MPSLHVGKKRIQTLAGSDGSVIPLGTVSAVPGPSGVVGGVVQVSVNAANNEVTVTGVNPGIQSVTYSAPGYQSATQSFDVSPLPSIVVTDGPEV